MVYIISLSPAASCFIYSLQIQLACAILHLVLPLLLQSCSRSQKVMMPFYAPTPINAKKGFWICSCMNTLFLWKTVSVWLFHSHGFFSLPLSYLISALPIWLAVLGALSSSLWVSFGYLLVSLKTVSVFLFLFCLIGEEMSFEKRKFQIYPTMLKPEVHFPLTYFPQGFFPSWYLQIDSFS